MIKGTISDETLDALTIILTNNEGWDYYYEGILLNNYGHQISEDKYVFIMEEPINSWESQYILYSFNCKKDIEAYQEIFDRLLDKFKAAEDDKNIKAVKIDNNSKEFKNLSDQYRKNEIEFLNKNIDKNIYINFKNYLGDFVIVNNFINKNEVSSIIKDFKNNAIDNEYNISNTENFEYYKNRYFKDLENTQILDAIKYYDAMDDSLESWIFFYNILKSNTIEKYVSKKSDSKDIFEIYYDRLSFSKNDILYLSDILKSEEDIYNIVDASGDVLDIFVSTSDFNYDTQFVVDRIQELISEHTNYDYEGVIFVDGNKVNYEYFY